ncbi:MAG: VWA domain-containing protein [Thermodesulfobacteriota bacterium]|nr:VWA domain-containing protein [Thermodesulfobacteriota bacterium]
MFRFADPWAFVLLAVIPVLILTRRKKSAPPAMGISEARTAARIRPSLRVRTRRLPAFSAYAVLVLLICALARPQWGTEKIETMTEGVNIVLAIDVSESMRALDFEKEGAVVNRLEAVKSVVSDFIARRDGDRIGMVVFGTQAFTQVPLTRDYNTITYILDHLEIGVAGGNTAIGDAIGISLKRLADIKSKSNVIVLLTDGESNTGALSPLEAADIAADKQVKIHAIGIGSTGKVPFPVNDPLFGRRYVYREVSIDEDALRTIADKTGGLYFKAEDTEALKQIYETIDRMEKTRVKAKHYAHYRDLYAYLAACAAILLVLRSVAENTRYLEIP